VNSALERMLVYRDTLWAVFVISLAVSIILTLIGFAVPLFFVIGWIGGGLTSFLLSWAILASMLFHHAEVVAEAGGPRMSAVPLSRAMDNRTEAKSEPTVAETPNTLRQERGPINAETGPVDFSEYAEGQITVVTRRLKKLTLEQREMWDRVGRPDLMDWNERDFDTWVAESTRGPFRM
jgi:hypothetical protein